MIEDNHSDQLSQGDATGPSVPSCIAWRFALIRRIDRQADRQTDRQTGKTDMSGDLAPSLGG